MGAQNEAQVRRLAFYPKMAQRHEHRAQYWTTVFGRLEGLKEEPLQHDRTVSGHANAYARQFCKDVQALEQLDDLAHSAERMQNRPFAIVAR